MICCPVCLTAPFRKVFAGRDMPDLGCLCDRMRVDPIKGEWEFRVSTRDPSGVVLYGDRLVRVRCGHGYHDVSPGLKEETVEEVVRQAIVHDVMNS